MKNQTDSNHLEVMDREDQMILSLLTAIDGNPDKTQKILSTQLGVAVGMVNSYLKRVIYKGYVKTKHLERRRLRYIITPSGIKEKSRLTYEFLTYSYQYINQVRRDVKNALVPLLEKGCNNIAFFGSGEVAELAYLAVRELKANLVAVIDPECVGFHCVEHVIRDITYLDRNRNIDVIVYIKKDQKYLSDIKALVENKRLDIVIC